MFDKRIKGGCQCGAVRYEVTGAPLMTAICHCTMCRRANAAPAVAWALFEEPQVTFTQATPKRYASSEEALRGFCKACGTPISFTATYIPGLIDLTIGSMDKPDSVAPDFHYWHAEHLAWAEFADGLPRHPGFPPMGDG